MFPGIPRVERGRRLHPRSVYDVASAADPSASSGASHIAANMS